MKTRLATLALLLLSAQRSWAVIYYYQCFNMDKQTKQIGQRFSADLSKDYLYIKGNLGGFQTPEELLYYRTGKTGEEGSMRGFQHFRFKPDWTSIKAPGDLFIDPTLSSGGSQLRPNENGGYIKFALGETYLSYLCVRPTNRDF